MHVVGTSGAACAFRRLRREEHGGLGAVGRCVRSAFGVCALGELLAVGMTCDDTCAGAQPPPGADWTQYSEAAQWTALGVLAGLNAAIALAATALTVFGHRRSAGALVVLFGAASVLLVVLDSEAGQGPFS